MREGGLYYSLIINLIGLTCICFGIFNTCGDLRTDGVEQNRETDRENDEGCVEEGFI